MDCRRVLSVGRYCLAFSASLSFLHTHNTRTSVVSLSVPVMHLTCGDGDGYTYT